MSEYVILNSINLLINLWLPDPAIANRALFGVAITIWGITVFF